MLRNYFLALVLLVTKIASSQDDSLTIARAFPITEYIVDLDDSLKLVQVYLPDNPAINEKQVGVLKGVYNTDHSDTAIKGAGRCQLIKGDYYYFAINIRKSGLLPAPGDLLYTLTPKPITYNGQLLSIAVHFIELQDVFENPFYDRNTIFNKWTEEDETNAIDTIVNDIIFTGKYFLDNAPENDVLISNGKFKDQNVFSVMVSCKTADVKDFLDYVIARPRLYAGRKWKMSEVFATWLSNGAPTVLKNLSK